MSNSDTWGRLVGDYKCEVWSNHCTCLIDRASVPTVDRRVDFRCDLFKIGKSVMELVGIEYKENSDDV